MSALAQRSISRSQWAVGFGAHFGPSRGDFSRRAFHQIEASKVAVRYVCNTSIRDVSSNISNAQTVVIGSNTRIKTLTTIAGLAHQCEKSF
jgi:hypothetical protein